jgi:hypothetical protein
MRHGGTSWYAATCSPGRAAVHGSTGPHHLTGVVALVALWISERHVRGYLNEDAARGCAPVLVEERVEATPVGW